MSHEFHPVMSFTGNSHGPTKYSHTSINAPHLWVTKAKIACENIQ